MALSNAILATPSTLVVPLSAIVDRLQGKLSAADLNALLLSVTGTVKSQVQPGDLISADLMNEVLAAIGDLQIRVAGLENSTAPPAAQAPSILALSSASINVGQTLTVSGLRFPSNPDLRSQVTLDGVPIQRFLTATSETLAFNIPALARALPADVVLTVGLPPLSATAQVRVFPAVVTVSGEVFVTSTTASLPQIVIGTAYNVDYQVESNTNVAESYRLQPVFRVGQGQATEQDWRTNARVLDLDAPGTPEVSQALVNPGVPRHVRIRFTIPAGATTATLALAAESVSQPANPRLSKVSNPPFALAVGHQTTPSDPRMTLAFGAVSTSAPNGRNAIIDGVTGIEIRYGQRHNIRATATVTATGAAIGLPGTYNYTFELSPDSTGWTVPSAGTALFPPSSTEAVGSSEDIGLSVTCDGTGTPQRTLRIIATRQADSDGPSFVSWAEIPIRGYT